MKTDILLILVLLSVYSCAAQRITLPLKVDNDQLSFAVKYGSQQCEINLQPSIEFCSNFITDKIGNNEQCGSQDLGINLVFQGENYSADFQLGNQQADLQFTVLSKPEATFYGRNQLCFGFYELEGFQTNTLIQLFEEGKISQQRVFFSLKNQVSSSSFIGQIDIGEPDNQLIQKGTKMAELKSQYSEGQNGYWAFVNNEITLFNEKIDSVKTAIFDLDSIFTSLTGQAFDNILSLFDKQGISYLKDEESNIFLPTIEKLQPIQLQLLKIDDNYFDISIHPSQYTRKIDNGNYQLLLRPKYYRGTISFGYPIFESYYVGFDLPQKNILINEKVEQKAQNFRGNAFSQQ